MRACIRLITRSVPFERAHGGLPQACLYFWSARAFFYLLVNLVICSEVVLVSVRPSVCLKSCFCNSVVCDPSLIFPVTSSVLVFLVGSSSLENDIARESVFHCEAELRLVEYIFLRLWAQK